MFHANMNDLMEYARKILTIYINIHGFQQKIVKIGHILIDLGRFSIKMRKI